MTPTTIGAGGIALVKEFEGFFPRPYWDRPMPDPKAVRTIGYGTTRIDGRAIRADDRLTEPQASDLLRAQVNGSQYAGALARELRAIGRKLNQHQFDALLSAVYNLGAGILEPGRSLGDALRSRRWKSAVPKALILYREPGTNVEKGLRRRREAEIALWRSKPPAVDRLVAEGYTTDEIRMIRTFDGWRRRGVNPQGRRRLAFDMKAQRQRIWRVAQPKVKGGDGRGWTAARKARYRSLLARSREV